MKKFLLIFAVFATAVAIYGSLHSLHFCNRANTGQDTLINYKLGETEVTINYKNFRNTGGVAYIILHDDENTAVEATDSVIADNGSAMIEIQAKGTRDIKFRLNGAVFAFDPNRIFTPVGVAKTLRNYGKTSPEAEKTVGDFGVFLISLLEKYDTVVAVHNNKRGYSLKDYLPGAAYQNDAEEVFWDKETSPNDFFFVVERDDFEALKEKGFNVVLQAPASVTDDGSLSVYCQQKGLRYFNCEAFEGNLKKQIDMLRALSGAE